MLLWWSSAAPAEAALDITGNWNISIVGELTLSCQAPVTQSGTNLTMDLTTCFAGVATGSINTSTGVFNVLWGGGPPNPSLGLNGTATASTMSGTWLAYAPPYYMGTFTGTIKAPPVGGMTELSGVVQPGGGGSAWPFATVAAAGTAVMAFGGLALRRVRTRR